MNTLALKLMSVKVQPLWDIALLRELASRVPFRPWMNFHIFGPYEFDIVFWKRSFQFFVLVWFMALVASWQTSIHYCQFWYIVRQMWFRVRIYGRRCGVIQGLDFLPGFVFPAWGIVAEMRISLKQDIRRDRFGSLGRLFMFDSTSFVKQAGSGSYD